MNLVLECRECFNVPQIWLTYEELAAFLNCPTSGARATAIAIGLDRRKSRDGRTRTKLTPPLAAAFVERLMQQHVQQAVATCAISLHAMCDRMAAPSDVIALKRAATKVS